MGEPLHPTSTALPIVATKDDARRPATSLPPRLAHLFRDTLRHGQFHPLLHLMVADDAAARSMPGAGHAD